ncbi:zinc-binding dehydrogenase [Bacillus sp. FJAT-26390]|uniref:zinc-binding dehydrogenase n=1 Tax=Bacillus sp. FJAT-26390 TaxID=1743142 RepID=UPI000807F8A6|nr:zinc-binding dehydrogenase [Bacillus sp. FJAT-26390]OBZ10840.1 hypothetical protein A7975_17675 [Bacillus sp. FJAT-26390]
MFIDYAKVDFETVISDYDIVFDTMGRTIQENSFQVLKKGGRLVSIVSPPDEAKAVEKGIKDGSLWLNPSGKQLQEIADLMAGNRIRAIVGHVFAFTQEGLRDAHKLSESHHARGKIVVKIK